MSKSIFLLCEYKVSIKTVIDLYNRGITIEEIYRNNDCIDALDGVSNEKKHRIIKATNKIYLSFKEHSIYELIIYGLSKNIVDKLYNLKISLEDLDDSIKYQYNIGDSTFNKIMNAFNKYLNRSEIKINISSEKLIKIIQEKFENNKFSIDELLSINTIKNHSNITELIESLIKTKKLKKIDNVFYQIPYSVLDLEEYGLSPTIIKNCLIKNNIDIYSIDDEIREKYHITPSNFYKIINAYNKMCKEKNIRKELYENKLLNIIKKNFKYEEFSVEEISLILKQKNYNYNNLEYLLKELIHSGKLNKKNTYKDCIEKYSVCLPKLIDELSKIPKENNHYDMVMKKYNGYTMEEIGQQYNLTRERIRQIVEKETRMIKRFQEEKYAEYIKEYNFDAELFTKLFKTHKYVYYFLKDKNKLGEKDPSELIDDDRLTSEQIEILRKRYNIIRYNGENIIANRNSILLAILKKVEKRIDYSELIRAYNSLVIEYKLDLQLLSSKDFRYVDSSLTRTNFVLDTVGKTYRYYNCNDIDKEDLEELKEMLNTNPGVYSTEAFFNDNTVLMKKLDIRDEYELHNLLKKRLSDYDENIIFSRMPDIFIHCKDKYKFVEEQIQELAPINIDEFVSYMYETYGHKPTSFKAYVLSNFSQYINIDILICNTVLFTDEQLKIMREKLTEDVYSILTIKQILTDNFDVNDFSLINSMNLKQIGYKLRGNYIIKDNISNLENHLRNIILQTDYYIVPSEMKKIGSTFSSYIYKFMCEKLLFKIEDEKYITVKKMNEMEIKKEDIDNFIDEIKKEIPENEYFSLYTLNKDFKNKLLEFNFPDCFYEGIITTINDVKYFRLNNNILFIRTKDSINREKFINSFIIKNKIYIRDIRNMIKEKYNIELQDYYIRSFVNRKKYYLDTSTDCIYESREKYEEDVKKWDILQYID